MSILLRKKVSDIPTSVILFFIFLLGILLYATSLQNGFIWDDIYNVVNNPLLESNVLLNFFSQPQHAAFPLSYRPLAYLSFKLDFLFWKLDSFGYHLTNIILHVINALLLYKLVFTILQDKPASLLASIIFLIHPTLSECPNHISARSYLLVLFFIFLTLLLYIKNNQRKNWISLVICYTSFFTALFCHEVSIVFPFFLLCYEYLHDKKFKNTTVFFLLTFIFLIIRMTVIPLCAYFNTIAPTSTLLTTPKVLFNYFKLMILPINLHKFWIINPITTIFGLDFIFYTLFSLGLLLLCWYLYKKNKKQSFMGLIWFIIMLLPFSQAKSNFYHFPQLSEIWLYVPAFGFILNICTIFAGSLRSTKKTIKITSLTLLISILMLFGILTKRQNILWGNPIRFFENMIQHGLTEPQFLMGLGSVYEKEEKFQKALYAYKDALAKYEQQDINANKNKVLALYKKIGILYLQLKQYNQAVITFDNALKIEPYNSKNRYNLSITYLMQNDIDNAIVECKKAIEIEHKAQYINLLNSLYAIKNHIKLNEPFTVNLKIIVD